MDETMDIHSAVLTLAAELLEVIHDGMGLQTQHVQVTCLFSDAECLMEFLLGNSANRLFIGFLAQSSEIRFCLLFLPFVLQGLLVSVGCHIVHRSIHKNASYDVHDGDLNECDEEQKYKLVYS